MNKFTKLAFIILIGFTFLLTSCEQIDISASGKIKSPSFKNTPIEGLWRVYKVQAIKGSSQNEIKKWDGKEAYFSSKEVYFSDEYCKDPIYKIKNVDAQSYFLYNEAVDPESIGIKQKNIEVITITSQDNYFYDFVKLDNNLILLDIDGVLVYLKKDSSNKMPSQAKALIEKSEESKASSSSTSSNSGVLLGLRYYKKSNTKLNTGVEALDKDDYYRTIWIPYTNNNIGTVLETDNLLVPRLAGFWKLWVNKGTYKNGLSFEKIAGEQFEKIRYYDDIKDYPFSYSGNEILGKKEAIDFIGNDYIGIDSYNSDEYKTSGNVDLKVLPIDNLNYTEGVRISKIMNNGFDILKSAASEWFGTVGDKTYIDNDPRDNNWGFARKNGHWVLKGRLDKRANSPLGQINDYYIPVAAPSTIVGYDNLYLTWSNIKQVVPNAEDAFSSVNKDMVIIVTKTFLYVYRVYDNKITGDAIYKIKLNDGETVVMDQWAQGFYVDLWTKSFKKDKYREIENYEH